MRLPQARAQARGRGDQDPRDAASRDVGHDAARTHTSDSGATRHDRPAGTCAARASAAASTSPRARSVMQRFTMSKSALGLSCASLLGLFAFAGCGNHYSTQEAYDICTQDEARNPGATKDSFAQCVACYEQCGSDCAPSATTPPLVYQCPD